MDQQIIIIEINQSFCVSWKCRHSVVNEVCSDTMMYCLEVEVMHGVVGRVSVHGGSTKSVYV